MAYSTITKPSDYFNTKLYTATGSAQSITGVGFQPDFVWIKDRESSGWHFWTDAVRGATKTIFSNSTSGESTETGGLTAFGTDGFSIGTHTNINTNGNNIVAWNWKANGLGSSNTDGSINTTYTSVNTTAGFSICKWAGSGANATIGHGLGVAPKVIITKSMASSTSWCFYHASLGNTKTLFLESNGTGNTHVAYYNNTSPTSSVFSVGTDSGVNHSGNDMIAYCFAEKKGYNKFDSYKGNGNADGTFVYTGFKPAFVIIKDTTTGGGGHSWCLWDNKRSTFNPTTKLLLPNATDTEYTLTDPIDFLSNGFKIRDNNGSRNDNGSTYIYMAFAENPFVANVGANGVPATAR